MGLSYVIVQQIGEFQSYGLMDRIAIEALTAEIDGGAVEGRAALSNLSSGKSSHFEATLKAERLDLDAATALARSLAGPQAEWPDEAQLSLDIGRAISAGQELRPLVAKLGYGPKTITLDQLKIGDASNVMMEGSGSFDRVNTAGRLALNSSAASGARPLATLSRQAPRSSTASALSTCEPEGRSSTRQLTACFKSRPTRT